MRAGPGPRHGPEAGQERKPGPGPGEQARHPRQEPKTHQPFALAGRKGGDMEEEPRTGRRGVRELSDAGEKEKARERQDRGRGGETRKGRE